MEPVQCAVVGLGVIGVEHAEVLHASAAADLTMCCDLNPEARSRAPAGVAFSSSLEETLSVPGLEAIFICTPEGTHRTAVEDALERGLAVFCEKPLASSLDDVRAMRSTAERTGGTLVVGHILRFDLRYLTLWESVRSGKLGRPIHLVARRTCWQDEGLTAGGRTTLPFYLGVHDLDVFRWYLGVHDLDVFRWLAGDIDRVYAEAGGAGVIGAGRADTVVATIRFVSGAVGSLELSWATPSAAGIEWDSRFTFIGTQGSGYVDIVETGVSIFSSAGPEFPDTTYWPKTYGRPSGILRTEDECFLAVVRDHGSWPLSLDDAEAAVVAALALDRSAAEGRPVSIAEIAG
jgi:predicted dehydrogenase